MNQYSYDDISVGHTETFTIAITPEMMNGFGKITGDFNPLHTGEQYAKNAGYKDKAVYGMLTSSFMSTLAGMYLPGENSLIHKVEAEFPSPVYIGDRLTFTGVVARKEDRFQTIELKVTATNSENRKVLRGKIRVGVRKLAS